MVVMMMVVIDPKSESSPIRITPPPWIIVVIGVRLVIIFGPKVDLLA
jgi:hypothetical protein